MKNYLKNLGGATSGFVNAIFGGQRHETISARWGKIGKKVRLWYWGCRMLNWFDKEHCEKSAAAHEKIREAIK